MFSKGEGNGIGLHCYSAVVECSGISAIIHTVCWIIYCISEQPDKDTSVNLDSELKGIVFTKKIKLKIIKIVQLKKQTKFS